MWLIISPALMFDQNAFVQKEIVGRQIVSFIAMTILHVCENNKSDSVF